MFSTERVEKECSLPPGVAEGHLSRIVGSLGMALSTGRLRVGVDVSLALLPGLAWESCSSPLQAWTSTRLSYQLEKEMATHSSILAWRTPWTEEPGWLQSSPNMMEDNFLKLIFIGVELIYYVVLVSVYSKVSQLHVYIYPFF